MLNLEDGFPKASRILRQLREDGIDPNSELGLKSIRMAFGLPANADPNEREPSSCSCRFEDGEWGDAKYHYRRMTEEIFVQKEMFLWFQTITGAIQHSPQEEEEARRRARDLSKHYVGQPFAYMMCPHYKAVAEREIAKEKLRTKNPSTRKRTYADSDDRDWGQ